MQSWELNKVWFTTQEGGAQRRHVGYPGAHSKLAQGPGLKLAPLAPT